MPSEVVKWIEPAGTERLLSDGTTIAVQRGRVGAFMPPVTHVRDRVPLAPGSRLREVRIEERELDLPLYVEQADNSALRTKMREILGWFNPTKGDGRLQVTSPDGSVRELICRYAGGLEVLEDEDHAGLNWQEFIAVFIAHDPFWYAQNATQATYTLGSPPVWFPILPLWLASSSIFSAPAVVNTGDVEAWPIWEITGPGAALALRNLTTGEVLALSTVLSAGDVLTVDTRPGRKTITRATTNLFGDKTPSSVLWSLAPGTNDVRIEMASAGVGSQVKLTYTPRYLGI